MTQFVFVVGMHRSGTSVVAGSLMQLGCVGPVAMMPAHPSNPKGHFEPEAAAHANDAYLESIGRSWHSFGALPKASVQNESAWVQRFAEVLRQDYPGDGLAVLKEPRVSLLLPMWRAAVALTGQPEPVYVLVFRPAGGTAASLRRRDGFSVEHSVALWLRYTLDAEFNTRGLRRSLVPIEQFTRNPVAVLDRLGRELGLTWPQSPQDRAADLGSFVEQELLKPPQEVSAPLIVLANSVLAALYSLTLDEQDAAARAELDRVRSLFDAVGEAPQQIRESQERIAELAIRVAALNAEVRTLADEVQAQRQRPLAAFGHLLGFHVLRLIARPLPLVSARLTERLAKLAQRRNPERPALSGKTLQVRHAARPVAVPDQTQDRQPTMATSS